MDEPRTIQQWLDRMELRIKGIVTDSSHDIRSKIDAALQRQLKELDSYLDEVVRSRVDRAITDRFEMMLARSFGVAARDVEELVARLVDERLSK